ncbi:hypothetical protein KP509_36G002600 [Ceratopteris richardii]|uniref:Sister chromatid cohesion 1 protein 1 n=1 Tax=Ceratopteris richardii TaxID=49495 RepID=A0A8T2QA95_CERRI|nr:hypothetical protein KP509_36G002600 [Ceratopteris richardii]KAH7280555.1 hypothetical protein KP509_36G002600 [Ceratopteris richardii]
MFYSNQLLSRKGPFGQIWIAATMHAKINRRKAEQIDIAELCEQILNPVVPLALRLSGILMGGVVLIYNRKVKFFSEDVNNLLIRIKLITTTKNLDNTSLPKEKSQARFEAITIEYGYNEDYHDWEREMLRSHKEHDAERANEEKFFYITEIEAPENMVASNHKFQAEQDKITIQEELQLETVTVNDNDDRIPPPDDIIIDDLCPEFQVQEEAQQTTAEEPNHEKVATTARSLDGSHESRGKIRRRKKRRRAVMDADFVEIPAEVLKVWIKQPDDLVKGVNGLRRTKPPYSSIIEKHFFFPSSSLCWNPASGIESTWTPPLLEVWKTTQSFKKSKVAPSAEPPEIQRQLRKRTTDITEKEMEVQNYEKGILDEDLSLREGAEIPEDIQERTDFPEFTEYGSIEKLRSAIHTPDPINGDELIINQLGLTPRFTGQSGKRKTGLPMSTPSTGRLSLEKDVDFPKYTSRTARSGSIQAEMSPGLELHPEEYLQETIGTNFHTVGEGKITGNSLSQFVLEETWPSQDLIRPRQQPIDKLTSSFLQVLREGFDEHPQRPISCDDLLGRVSRSQAARAFYQICVVASNAYVSVEQHQPYGEILLRRGPYM